MATQPTNQPVPSESPRDLKFNAGKIDEFVTSSGLKYTDRFGGEHYTIEGLRWLAQQTMEAFGYITLDSFEDGNTLTLPNQVLRLEATGEYYRWDGALPKVVPAGSTPASAGGIGVGAWLSVGDATLRTDVTDFAWHDSLELAIAKMASGDAVSIVCYGDSTTDGNGTSGWTQNPINPNGTATGNNNHNLTAPNSWPVVLQGILRDMYENNNISVHNAGYSGQRMDNGWAVNNYDVAVANNKFYGTGDITIIDFGLNDIQGGVGVLNNHITQTEIFVQKLLRAGSLPVLLSSGPEFRDTEDGGLRDNEQISQQINVAKRSICKKYKLPFIDKALAIKLWLENGASGSNWMTAQPDALHFGDLGHRFQAAFIASKLYGDIIEVERGGVQNIPFMDSRSNSPAGNVQIYKSLKTKFGANPIFTKQFVSSNLGRAVMKCWVWCNTSEAGLVYNSIDNDYQSVYDTGLNSKITVRDIVSNVVLHDMPPPNVGFRINQSGAFRGADVPLAVSNTGYGLNLVEYSLPSSVSVMENQTLFHGFFTFVDKFNSTKINGRANLLRDIGDIYYQTSSFTGGNYIQPVPKLENMSNAVSVINGLTTSILLDLDMSKGYGIGVMGGNAGVSAAEPVHVDAGIMIYQLSATRARIYNYFLDSDGSVGFSGSLGEFDRGAHDGNLRVDISKSTAGDITLTIYSNWTNNTSLISLTLKSGEVMKWQPGGRVGAVFINRGEAEPGGYVHLKKALMLRY